MKLISFFKSCLVYIPFLILNGCAVKEKTSPISNAFLEDVDVTKKIENLPFKHSWVWHEIKREDFDSLIVAPVTLTHLPKDYWKNSRSAVMTSEEGFNEEAKLIAEYFRKRIIEEITRYPETKFKIADAPGPKTLMMEITLTEIEFSHPVSRAAALAAPVPGVGAAMSTISSPHAAFALRILESESKKLIATIADRKYPPKRLVDLNKLTITSSIREVCNLWAEKIVETLNKGHFAEISDSSSISILPW